MGKRGASHIEMILSFVIFVAALGFAFYFFSPGGGSRLVDSSFSYIFREIEKNSSSDVLIYSIKINENVPTQIIGFNLSGSGANSKAVVFKEDGINLTSDKVGEIVYSEPRGNWINNEYLSVVLSEDIEDNSLTAVFVNESYYNISSSLAKRVLSEIRIVELNKTYYSNYTGLKKQFNIPGRVNFGFVLAFSDGNSIKSEQEIPKEFEVFVDNKRVEVIRVNGRIEFADLSVKVW